MFGFTVSVNGVSVGALSTDGLDMVTINVHGDTIGPEFAVIDIAGGNYEPGSPARHLIYMSELQIAEGDFVEIRFMNEVETTLQGRTIEELYPENPEEPVKLESDEQELRNLEAEPRVREHFSFEVTTPGGELITGTTPPGTFTFGLHFLWRRSRPECARVSVSSNSLSRIAKKEDGERYVDFALYPNQAIGIHMGK